MVLAIMDIEVLGGDLRLALKVIRDPGLLDLLVGFAGRCLGSLDPLGFLSVYFEP